MPKNTFGYILLIVTAILWGSGYVPQHVGAKILPPFSFNAGRFLIATVVLSFIWLAICIYKKDTKICNQKLFALGGILAGTWLFAGYSFMQMGLQYTTAGNAGFITSMYIVLVPVLGLLIKQKTQLSTWLGVSLAVFGLYTLSIADNFQINRGDGLVFLGAFFWAAHVLTLGWLSRHVDDLLGITVIQFLVGTIWSIPQALLIEDVGITDYQKALAPLLYSALIVSGLAFTLQIIGQRTVNESIAAIILSGEAVFALFFGWLILDEPIGNRQLMGCSFMIIGIVVSQWAESKNLISTADT